MIPNDILLRVAKEYGTPLYIYDQHKISTQYEHLKTAFKDQNVSFFYASKALTNIHILKLISSLGACVDCSSINEVKIAKYAGVPSGKILYTSNSISFEEITDAVNEEVSVNIDSLSNLRKFGQKYGHSYPVGIRLRPNIMGGENLKISTGHEKSKFGIPIDEMDEILRVVQQYDLDVATLHIHTGSGISKVAIFMKSVHIMLTASKNFPTLKHLDFGGGFKVPFKEDEVGVDIEELAKEIDSAVRSAEEEQDKKFEIWFEPGKFLVSEAGSLLAKVNVLKPTKTIDFVGLDTGFNHLIRPMFYESYHIIDNLSNPDGKRKAYTVVGNLCETDTFATDRLLPEVSENDILRFRNAGAYGFEMASSFNSRCRPAELLINGEEVKLIRKRETIEDLLHNQLVD